MDGGFQGLKYDSDEKQMKCKVCLDAYGCLPKPLQSFVHGANNFQHSSPTWHQSGNDHVVAMNIIKQRRSQENVMHHVQEKASTALKAQVRTAFVMRKKIIPDRKFNASIDLQVNEVYWFHFRDRLSTRNFFLVYLLFMCGQIWRKMMRFCIDMTLLLMSYETVFLKCARKMP